MGPVISQESRDRIERPHRRGLATGRAPSSTAAAPVSAAASRATSSRPRCSTASCPVRSGRKTEVFGPVLERDAPSSVDEAIALREQPRLRQHGLSVHAQRRRRPPVPLRDRVGNVGINVGVAAPMAFFPFSAAGRRASSATCTRRARTRSSSTRRRRSWSSAGRRSGRANSKRQVLNRVLVRGGTAPQPSPSRGPGRSNPPLRCTSTQATRPAGAPAQTRPVATRRLVCSSNRPCPRDGDRCGPVPPPDTRAMVANGGLAGRPSSPRSPAGSAGQPLLRDSQAPGQLACIGALRHAAWCPAQRLSAARNGRPQGTARAAGSASKPDTGRSPLTLGAATRRERQQSPRARPPRRTDNCAAGQTGPCLSRAFRRRVGPSAGRRQRRS